MKEKVGNAKSTIWYVQPLDAVTNEVIAKHLALTSDVSETISIEVDGKKIHDLYLLPGYSVLNRLYQFKASMGLKFKAYRQVGPKGRAKLWKFGEKKKKALA
ncbi:MAG: hypothetical protein ACM3PZ_00660 [Bacillota bacterium]